MALISDAGTPLISDPGYRLVHWARQAGIRVTPVPGACALIAALCASGLPSDRFCFEGFLAAKSSARRGQLEAAKTEARTWYFMNPHRIEDCLADLVAVFGPERSAVMARELTKTFETFLTGSLAEIAEQVAADANQRKGEIVLMVQGFSPPEQADQLDAEALRIMDILLTELPVKQAASLTARITGEKK